jgi:AcrR family transcriptional regulator
MNPQVKTKPDDTRARIVDAAEMLFRRLGFAKTAVADIAGELGMSPANVYRFFPSKNAIVEAICQRCLAEVEDKAWAVARGRGSAADRMERMILDIFTYHRDNFIAEQRVHDMVLVAIEHSWDAIKVHKQAMHAALELIVRDGIAAREFEVVDPRETATVMMQSLIRYTHPLVIADCLKDHDDIEGELRRSVRFLLRAITPRT